MDLVPLRVAAGGGSIDGVPAAQLVAAGFTLLQRSAPLARALAGRRSAILLPDSAHFLTALAASDGRGAVLIPPSATASEVVSLLVSHRVGAVFTLAELADRLLDAATPRVLLDDSPATARVILTPMAGPQEDRQVDREADSHVDRRVDLGSHFGLELSGDDNAPGRDEECVVIGGVVHTHRASLESARRVLAEPALLRAGTLLGTPGVFTEFDGLVRGLIAPLMAGAHVTTR